MKPFTIEITEITEGPDELRYQIPVKGKTLKKLAGKDRPDYWLVELEKSLFWIDKKKNINREISHIVVCSKIKGETINDDMQKMTIAIAYVIDSSLLSDTVLNFKKSHYIAVGVSSALSKWSFFK